MAFCLDFVQSIATGDDINRKIFIEDSRNTIYLTFALMDIQGKWSEKKGDDRTSSVLESMTPGGAGKAAFWNGQYQADTQIAEIATSHQQSMISANQTQIDGDNDARKNNLGVADGLASMFAAVNGMIISAGHS